ncbi:MAG: hypothetical protein DRM98_02470 [Thermoplasmata archaeon]|nr:MAG: hypothetical protein DRM98_02470 [Thermoplasmata archaeon]
MKKEPEIVKQLREEERRGKLKNKTGKIYYFYNLDLEEVEEKNILNDENLDYSKIKLGKIKEKYLPIFENYFVGITIADEKERIVSWNKYAEELLQMNEKDLFLRNVRTLYPPEEWNRIRGENIRQKGIKYKMETKMVRKNGETFDVELSLCVLKGHGGKTVGSVGIFKDNSMLKDMERRLVNTEEKYKTIFENSAVAIMLTDEHERIVSWNKYTETLLGMSEKDLRGKPVSMLYPPEEWKKIRGERIRDKGMQHHLETKIIKKNGELLDVDVSISVLKNHEGKVIGSIGVIKDITEQKKIEDKLAFSQGLFQSLMENIPDYIYFKDRDCRFVMVNRAKAARFNVEPSDMIGKTDFDFLLKDEAEKSLKQDKKVMETGKPIVNSIEKMTDRDGVEHWVSVTKIPRYNQEGEIVGIIGINRDVTEVIKSENKYRNLFETAIDPILILDREGRFVEVNKQVTKILGYTRKDLIGKRFDEIKILTPESLSRVADSFMKRMNGVDVPSYEVEVLTKKGERIPVEINANALLEGNEIIGDLVIIRDLREKKKKEEMEQELLESERRFRNIFDSTGDFLLYLEKNVILDINRAALSLGGLKKEDVVGKPFFDALKKLFSKEDLEKHIDAINYASQGVEVPEYETEVKTSDGNRYRFSFSVDCIRDEKKVSGVLVRGRDITYRQKAWEELVKLEEKYRVLAETSADGVITIDPLGRLTYVNPAFEKMCKRRKSKILATLFRDYLSEDSVYFFQQVFIDVRRTGEKIENVELELVDANSDVIPIEVNMAPFKKDEEFAGVVCTIRDITERRRIEDELKKSERLKTEFMNIAAHELKSPVTPIKGYLDLIISDKNATEKIKEWARVSLRNSERLLKLVNDILDVSRLDTDTMRFDMEKLNTVELLDEIAEDMKPAVENKNLKFIVDIPRDLPNVMGDKYRLSQVLKNILVNAIKFTDEGSISIKAEKKDNYILISVKDTGIGISKDDLKKIFTKFYQAYTGDDRKNEGTGLGLFICKEIVKKHDGEIWVESKLGKGSTFYIKLPYLHKMVLDSSS